MAQLSDGTTGLKPPPRQSKQDLVNYNDASWYFTKEELENTPTCLQGKTPEEEALLRKEGASFIQDVGCEMKMPQLTIATAIVFFQRFYVYKSFLDYPPRDMGTVCLFLAGKVEETPKKLRDILLKAEYVKSNRTVMPREDSEELAALKTKLLDDERVLLQTISFDLTVEHPYKYLLAFCKALKSDKSFAQTAWNFVNDSLRSTICLQYNPRVVACAVILLSSKMRGFVLPSTVDGKEWYKAFLDDSVTREDLEAVGEQIKQLYPEEALQGEMRWLLGSGESGSASHTPQPSSQGRSLSQSTSRTPQSQPDGTPGGGMKRPHPENAQGFA